VIVDMEKIMLIKSLKRTNILILMLAVISMSLLMSGCTDNTAGTDNTLTDAKLQIAGSTTVLPVAEE